MVRKILLHNVWYGCELRQNLTYSCGVQFYGWSAFPESPNGVHDVVIVGGFAEREHGPERPVLFVNLRPVSRVYDQIHVGQFVEKLEKEMFHPRTSRWENAIQLPVQAVADDLVEGAPKDTFVIKINRLSVSVDTNFSLTLSINFFVMPPLKFCKSAIMEGK